MVSCEGVGGDDQPRRTMLLCLVKGFEWHFSGLILGLWSECLELAAGMRTRQGGAARMLEGKLLSGHARQVRMGARGRLANRSKASRMRQPIIGSGRPRELVLAGGSAQVGVHLAGDITLEAADDLFL